MITLKKADYNEIMGYKKTKLQELVDDFIAMGEACAEVNSTEHKSPGSCASSLSAYIRRNGITHIKVKGINGKVYLFNELVVKKIEQQG